jgi:tartrate-resistant acid phosphatase type 5
MRWLETTLARSTADYLWLAGHYPIYDPRSVDPRKRAAFVPLMRKYNAPGYIAGHCHTMQHFDSVGRVAAGGDGFAFVVSGCGKECNNPEQPANATQAWNSGCEDATCGNTTVVVQSYRYNPNTTQRVNSSFVSMRVQAEGTTISYVSDKSEVMFTAKPVRRRQWNP